MEPQVLQKHNILTVCSNKVTGNGHQVTRCPTQICTLRSSLASLQGVTKCVGHFCRVLRTMDSLEITWLPLPGPDSYVANRSLQEPWPPCVHAYSHPETYFLRGGAKEEIRVRAVGPWVLEPGCVSSCQVSASMQSHRPTRRPVPPKQICGRIEKKLANQKGESQTNCGRIWGWTPVRAGLFCPQKP